MKSHLWQHSMTRGACRSDFERAGHRKCGVGGRREGGAVMPLAVIALFAMVGLVGLVTDYAPLFWDRNKLQNATDAAALAAAEYLKKNPSAGQADVISQAELVFKSQMPAGAVLKEVIVDKDSVRVKAEFIHNAFLTRIYSGAKPSVTVSSESYAKQQTIETVQACISPMVICSDADLPAGTTKNFVVGTDVVFLCEDGDKNCTSSLDDRMAKGSYPFGGGVIDPVANGAICYKIP
ncbi:MAG: putative Flp pilus-assembly TadE/G-like, partial [Pseudomonadota bacterium]